MTTLASTQASPPSPAEALPAALRFSRFELQPRQRRLLSDGSEVALGARAFDLLLALAAQPGQLLGKHELMDIVWPGLVVEENNLAVQVANLRKVLGGETIATVPGRGYRFTAHWTPLAPALPPSTPAAPPAAPDGVEAPAIAAPVATGFKTNLPGLLTPLIGRDDDLAALHALLDAHGLVTLAGAGGVGKTLLAQHALAERAARHGHGVCWVELASTSDAAALPATIAAAMGVRAGGTDALAALGAALAPLDLLVALDNAEHLQDEVAALAAALQAAAPRLRLLVTSQAALRIADEHVLRLGTLAVPDEGTPAADAAGFGAVALFCDRARAAGARWTLDDGNVATVITLCHALDGLALAIELAAARLPALGLQRLVAVLHERLQLLTAGRKRHAPARQQTLRATLDWSHALLPEREQAVFRRLSVVAGSAALALVQQTARCERWDEWEVLDALDQLVDRSLVVVLEMGAAQAPRYRLLESPRAYAREQLQASGEAEPVRRRHAQAVLFLLDEQAEQRDTGAVGWEAGLALARRDADNARDAFEWARAAAEPALALGIASQLLRLLTTRSLAQVLALCDACEALLAEPNALAAELRTQAWSAVGWALTDARMARSLAAGQRGVAAARELPPGATPDFLLCRSLAEYAVPASGLGKLADARQAMDEMLQLERAAWPAAMLAQGANARYRVLAACGEHAAALRQAQQAIGLQQACGADSRLNRIVLVDLQLSSGDAAAAVRTGRALVAELECSRDLHNLAFVRLNLAAAHLALDEVDAADALLQAGWAQVPVFDFMAAYLADYMALLSALRGRPEAAVRLAAYADARYAAFDDSRQANEAAAVQRALALAEAVLPAKAMKALRDEGASMSEVQAAACVFPTA